MKKIAIFGATGYIGKSLVHRFSKDTPFEVFLFVRSKEKMSGFLRDIGAIDRFSIHFIDSFDEFKYDVVINCAGIGNPATLKNNPAEIFKVTEEFDTRIIEHLKRNTQTLYINLSSGAVYGLNISSPVEDDTKASLDINNLKQKDFYSIAKIHSEAEHRALLDLNIVDIRVFSFFSRFADTDSSFLMSEIAGCIKNKKTFVTSGESIIRDYIGAEDLFSFIVLVMKKEKVNDFFDIYSLQPVEKFQLLEALNKSHGLVYSLKEGSVASSPTGTKNSYFSKSKKAENIGYVPKFTSLELIEQEIGFFV